jgi:hypothetical protein
MIRTADGIQESVQGNEIVLFNLNTGEFYGLQDISYYIWQLLGTCSSVEEIIREIKKNFKVDDEKEMRKEVINFLSELKKEGLIDSNESI